MTWQNDVVELARTGRSGTGNRVGCDSPRGFKSRILRALSRRYAGHPLMDARRIAAIDRTWVSVRGLSSPLRCHIRYARAGWWVILPVTIRAGSDQHPCQLRRFALR